MAKKDFSAKKNDVQVENKKSIPSNPGSTWWGKTIIIVILLSMVALPLLCAILLLTQK